MAVPAKIYLAIDGAYYEGFNVVGVYTSPELARQRISQITRHYSDYVEVQVFTLNGARLEDDPDDIRVVLNKRSV